MDEVLIAQAHIQYRDKRYKPGDALPACELSSAWLASGAAIPVTDYVTIERPRAERSAAEPGLPGLAVGGEYAGDDLVGKIPMTRERKKR